MTQSALLCFVNGKRVFDEKVDPEETLLYYLRNKLHLCGTKLGCGEGGCGACTVMVSNYSNGKVIHKAVNACLAPIASVHLCAVTTVEGIGSTKTKLHRVQQTLVENHGSQCGFCTPGIVMSMYTLLRNKPIPTEEMVERSLQGNLCRCTGYRPIMQGFKLFTSDHVTKTASSGCPMGENCCKNKKNSNCDDSSKSVNSKSEESNLSNVYVPDHLTQEPIFPPELKSAKQNDLKIVGPRATWYRPTSLEDLMRIRFNNPTSKIITGNTECGVETKFRGWLYPHLISPVAVPELNKITITHDQITLGASTTLNEIDQAFVEWINVENHSTKTQIAAAVCEMLKWFAGDQIRNVSAIGGNLMTASPISDLTPILMAAGATVTYGVSPAFISSAKLDEKFFTGYRKTVIPNTSTLLTITIPNCSDNAYFLAYKQSKRKEDDIAIVNAAFNVEFEPNSIKVKSFKASYGGMGPSTRLAVITNKLVPGLEWTEKTLTKITDALAKEFHLPATAPGGFIAYRKCLVTSLFFKFFITVQAGLMEKGLVSKSITNFSAIGDIQKLPTESIVSYDIATKDAVGKPVQHMSAAKQVTGEAVYLDDIPASVNDGYFAPVLSTHANARIVSIDWSEAEKLDTVIGTVCHTDVPGDNNIDDEEFCRSEYVTSCGQIIGGVIANDEKIARRAAKLVKVTYEDIFPVIVTIEDAIKHNSYLNGPRLSHNVGDVEGGFSSSTHQLSSEVRMGGQEHFYFETNAAYAKPVDNCREMEVHSSCQNVAHAQHSIAHALGVGMHSITVRTKRLGGGFGGKESRFHLLTSVIAVAANKFNRPVRCMLDRDEDMMHSGGRHAFLSKYKVGFESNGKINSVEIMGYQNSGSNIDLSIGVLSRYIDHAINCYNFPNFKIIGHCMLTNTPSNTAFRGFGGPQGMLVAEDIISKIADSLGMMPEDVRRVNMLQVGHRLPFGTDDKQILTDEHILQDCFDKCNSSFMIEDRRQRIKQFNEENKWKKRGVSIVPTMFGVAFGLKHMNQGGALVHIYTDGTVLVSHGGIEMGQGLYTKMIQIASKVLDIPVEKIHTAETSTTTVPNASPTAASYSSDVNGWAVKKACEILKERLDIAHEQKPFASWEELIKHAYASRISLSASAFWKNTDVTWDPVARLGKRYNYHCYGTSASEVEVDLLTGHHEIIETEIMMDVGRSLNPAIDVGQIEGAFMQGVGLMTIEEELYNPKGQLLTRGPGAYKIPGFGDIPKKFKVSLYDKFSNRHGLYHSKGVGEPPLFMGASVFYAIRDAVREASTKQVMDFNSPATVENIRMACDDTFSLQAKTTTEETDSPWCVRR